MITIDNDYLDCCSRSVPTMKTPAATVLLRHRGTGVITRHALMADGMTISRQGTICEGINYDAGFGMWPYRESLIRL